MKKITLRRWSTLRYMDFDTPEACLAVLQTMANTSLGPWTNGTSVANLFNEENPPAPVINPDVALTSVDLTSRYSFHHALSNLPRCLQLLQFIPTLTELKLHFHESLVFPEQSTPGPLSFALGLAFTGTHSASADFYWSAAANNVKPLQHLRNLQSLTLSGPIYFKRAEASLLFGGSFTSLRRLVMKDSNSSSLDLEWITALQNLESLALWRVNSLCNASGLFGMTSLRELDIRDCTFASKNCVIPLNAITNLHTLRIYRCNRFVGFSDFRTARPNLTELVVLCSRDPMIHALPLAKAVSKCIKLKELSIPLTPQENLAELSTRLTQLGKLVLWTFARPISQLKQQLASSQLNSFSTLRTFRLFLCETRGTFEDSDVALYAPQCNAKVEFYAHLPPFRDHSPPSQIVKIEDHLKRHLEERKLKRRKEELAAMGLHLCDNCEKLEPAPGTFSRCGACKAVWYCNTTCQRQVWKTSMLFGNL